MESILMFGIAMAFVSGLFWIAEAMPYVKKVRELKSQHSKDIANLPPDKFTIKKGTHNTIYVVKTTAYLYLLFPLFLDLFITSSLASIFQFGGMVGGIIGLFISNILSLFILITSHQFKNA